MQTRSHIINPNARRCCVFLSDSRRDHLAYIRSDLAKGEQHPVRQKAAQPSGRRLFCPTPALARQSKPAEGILLPCRLGFGQNTSSRHTLGFII
jgi:hypothetical protein